MLIQDENESILSFDEARDSLAINESSLKSPIQMASTLVPSFEEAMEVQVQVQKEGEPTKVQEGQGKKKRSFWILRTKKLSQSLT